MDNMLKIKKVSKLFYLLFTGFLIILPMYYILYWLYINSLLEILNLNHISFKLKVVGLISSLLPLSALIYGVNNIRKLFLLYKEGIIFSSEQVKLFKKIARALVLWILFSVIYDSIKSVIFTWNNPEGSRLLSISFNTNQIGILIISVIIFVIAWIMDEGRVVYEENKFTV